MEDTVFCKTTGRRAIVKSRGKTDNERVVICWVDTGREQTFPDTAEFEKAVSTSKKQSSNKKRNPFR